jgi:hypothetical protein
LLDRMSNVVVAPTPLSLFSVVDHHMNDVH